MAVDMFLKLDGIPGESSDDKHKGEIEVLSFSWGVTQTTTSSSGGGGGAGKAQVSAFSIVKQLDKSSPLFFEKACGGGNVGTGLFTLTDRATGLGFYKVRFDDVLISSVQPAASAGQTTPMESISFNFTKVEISAAGQKGDFATETACGSTPTSVGHNHDHE